MSFFELCLFDRIGIIFLNKCALHNHLMVRRMYDVEMVKMLQEADKQMFSATTVSNRMYVVIYLSVQLDGSIVLNNWHVQKLYLNCYTLQKNICTRRLLTLKSNTRDTT